MNDTVVEKLVQKVINLIEEVNDVNIVVRGITPPQAIVNKIHERIDLLLAAIQQIEKKLDLDEGRLKQLEYQTILLKEEMESRKSAIYDVGEKIGALGQDVHQRLPAMDDQARKRFEKMGETFQTVFEIQKEWLIGLSALSVILVVLVIILLNR